MAKDTMEDDKAISNEVHSLVKEIGLTKFKNKYASKKSIATSDLGSKKYGTKQMNIAVIPNRKFPLIKPGAKWHDSKANFENAPTNETTSRLFELHTLASKLMESDKKIYDSHQERGRKRSEMAWIKTAIKSGTLADKIAALTLLIQDSPVHNLSAIENMINLVKTKKKRECLMALDSLKELFISDLLIHDKKLKKFNQNPLDNIESLCSRNLDMIHRQLIIWYFEEDLKKCYENFLLAVEAMTYDSVESTKQKALLIMFELLSTNPEQEQLLLTKLVNKVGDPLHRVAAKAARFLSLLIQKHPDMNAVVVNEVEYLLYRPNIAKKAQYYAICFLNQIIFSKEDHELASKLINIYFGFFKLCHKKGEVDSKMMSALLTGINRAFPYISKELDSITEQIDAMYKIVHSVNVNISIQALMLLFQIMSSKDALTDRYYSALYRKLQDPDLKLCNRHPMLLNLLYKSLKKDSSEKRVKAFIRRLLQMCKYFNPHVVCGILFLISELLKSSPQLIVLNQNALIIEQEKTKEFDSKFLDQDDENEKKPASSWVHRVNLSDNKNTDYNPNDRNPLYAGAENSCTWELCALSKHFHPSVCLFASNILEGKVIEYDGDPLQDFTLIRFLDRFVFRNPKKVTDSNMNEVKERSVFCKRLLKQLPIGKQVAADSKKFISMPERNVSADDKFLFNYFTQREKDRKHVGVGDDNASVTSDQFDDYLNKMEPGHQRDLFGVDFATAFSSSKQKKRKGKNIDDNSDLDDDLEFDEGELDDEFNEYDDLINGNNMEVDPAPDDEDFPFPEDDNEDGFEEEVSRVKKKHKKSKYDTSGLFASAEKFAEVLDDNVNNELMNIGTEALANKDNADVKQLKWEMQRDRQIKGHDWKDKRRMKSGGRKVNKMGKRKKFGG